MTDFLNNWLLTILIFLPTAGAVLVLLAKGRDAVRWTALVTCIVTFALSLLLFATFDWKTGAGVYDYAPHGVVQMVTRHPWIPAFNIDYLVGIDGLSFPLVILSTFICLLACIASWNIDEILKGYRCLFLLLEPCI